MKCPVLFRRFGTTCASGHYPVYLRSQFLCAFNAYGLPKRTAMGMLFFYRCAAKNIYPIPIMSEVRTGQLGSTIGLNTAWKTEVPGNPVTVGGADSTTRTSILQVDTRYARVAHILPLHVGRTSPCLSRPDYTVRPKPCINAILQKKI